jgi:hypothetical protein
MKTRLTVLLCVIAVSAWAQSPGAFTATGNMITPRVGHTATLLPNGKVLIAGGFATGDVNAATFPAPPVSSAELYDPSTGAFTATGQMTTTRSGHTATLLPNGTVLIAGGLTYNANVIGTFLVTSAELYDPSTGTFTPTGDMAAFQTVSALLPNGKVLMTGSAQYPSVRAELYDPATGTFALAGPFSSTSPDIVGHATLLADGSVLLTPDWRFATSGHAELYDPGTDTFVTTGSMTDPYTISTATLLMNGKVLFVGNEENDLLTPAYTEVYDPANGSFAFAGHAQIPNADSTATVLPDGKVLIAGSQLDCGVSDARAELYDSAAGTFSITGDMITPRYGHTATLLPDGTVLVAGGDLKQIPLCDATFFPPTSSAEIYHPAALVPAPALFSLSGDGRGQGAIWNGVTGRIASPANPASAGDVLSTYTTSLFEGGVIPPQVAVGGQLAEVLFFGDAPGYPGYFQVNFRVPSGVAAESVVPVRLTYIGRPSNSVTMGVQ